MNAQAPTQAGTSFSALPSTNTHPNNKTSQPLLSDPTFQAIHNAFLLGWNLMELKSRIQITACILSLDPDAVINALHHPASTQPDSQPQSQDNQNNLPDSIDSLLENVVLKDVLSWKDVQNQQAQSSTPPSQEKSLSTELRDNVWLTSVLRAIFMQIATLHVKRFPKSDVTNTIYDIHPPSEPVLQPQPAPQLPVADNIHPATDQQYDKNSQNAYDQQTDQEPIPYPYLYPEKFDYANVGIRIIKQDDVGNNNIDIPSFVKNFRIYPVTRRVLNCLTLLLTTPEDSLDPETIKLYQKQLVQKVLDKDLTELKDKDIKDVIKVLSDVAVHLLEGWDSFLRESFYVDTNSQNDDQDSSNYEIGLVAYEAGRSLAALSWGVSVALVPLENIFPAEAGNDQNDNIRNKLNKKTQDSWMNVFNDRDVNHVQHQIAALSTALDEAYYRVHPDVKPPGSDDPLVPLNLDLPGQAIRAVNHSLDYWERAIARICNEKKPLPAPIPAKTVTPTTASTNMQLAVGTPRPSKPLDWEMSKTLRTELIQQSTVWQSLILYQQGLRSFTVETVTQKILNEFMQDFEAAASKEIFNSGAFWWTLGIIGIILVLLVLGTIGAILIPGLSDLISKPPVIIATIVTTIAAVATPFLNGFLGRLSKIGSFFGSAGTTLEQALENGYAQILREFDYLNHNIGVTFPLIEFFVWEEIKFGDNPIEDGYDFLVQVFWTSQDREEEIQRVARAAFGPIGAFVGGSLKLGDDGSQKTSQSSKNNSKNSKQADQQRGTKAPGKENVGEPSSSTSIHH